MREKELLHRCLVFFFWENQNLFIQLKRKQKINGESFIYNLYK
jgi:hypothetical protein